jgi:hypothetical protein
VQKKLSSEGVTSFNVSDCNECNLKAYEDPVTAPPELEDPAHALVDFTPFGLDEKQYKK